MIKTLIQQLSHAFGPRQGMGFPISESFDRDNIPTYIKEGYVMEPKFDKDGNIVDIRMVKKEITDE